MIFPKNIIGCDLYCFAIELALAFYPKEDFGRNVQGIICWMFDAHLKLRQNVVEYIGLSYWETKRRTTRQHTYEKSTNCDVFPNIVLVMCTFGFVVITIVI